MSAKNAINAAYYAKLSGGTALVAMLGGTAIYYQHAPDGASLPYVIFSHPSGGPTNDTPSDNREQVTFVRGYASAPSQAGSIDAACSALLHRQALSVSGYTNYWLVREDEFSAVETPKDQAKIYMEGAYYRARLDS